MRTLAGEPASPLLEVISPVHKTCPIQKLLEISIGTFSVYKADVHIEIGKQREEAGRYPGEFLVLVPYRLSTGLHEVECHVGRKYKRSSVS